MNTTSTGPTIEITMPEGAMPHLEVLKTELPTRIFPIDENNFRNPNCIDGRDSDNARPSIPGGSLGALGVVLVAFDASNHDTNARHGVIQVVKEYFGDNFGGHSDTHNNTDTTHNCKGCGHADRLLTQHARYALSGASQGALQHVVGQIPEENIDILPGDHAERSVIIVDLPGYGIASNTTTGQDFVYNRAYARELYGEILDELSKFGIELDLDELLKIEELHVMNTASDLAKGLPVYLVTRVDNNGIPEINFAMMIPDEGKVGEDDGVNREVTNFL